jgi:MIP family channel proteins
MLKGTLREVAAEFLGTFVLIVFGVAVVAQVMLSGQSAGEYLSINVGWGVAVTLAVYTAAGVSGAHLNPAVTLAVALFRDFSWSKVLPYVLAQLAGAFIASCVVYVTYHEALDAYTGGIREVPGVVGVSKPTAGIWATYPQTFADGTRLSTFPGGLIDQIVGTALLVLVIFAVGDQRNAAPKSNMAPVIVGATVLLIGMTFGYNSGYAINPARDFGPRLFTYFAGWGKDVFTSCDSWWWVPIVGPLIGGALGGYAYDLCIGRHHPPENADAA